MPDFAHAGTVSHGTHRPQDLIPTFLAKLQELAPERAAKIRTTFVRYSEGDADVGAEELLDELFEALSDCAPEGWYFGASEGDGADFGFWQDESILPPGQSLGTWANDA